MADLGPFTAIHVSAALSDDVMQLLLQQRLLKMPRKGGRMVTPGGPPAGLQVRNATLFLVHTLLAHSCVYFSPLPPCHAAQIIACVLPIRMGVCGTDILPQETLIMCLIKRLFCGSVPVRLPPCEPWICPGIDIHEVRCRGSREKCPSPWVCKALLALGVAIQERSL